MVVCGVYAGIEAASRECRSPDIRLPGGFALMDEELGQGDVEGNGGKVAECAMLACDLLRIGTGN